MLRFCVLQQRLRELAGGLSVVFARLITAGQSRAEEGLRESEERLRTLMEQSPLAIQIMTPDGHIVQVNDAYEKLWGITLEDLRIQHSPG